MYCETDLYSNYSAITGFLCIIYVCSNGEQSVYNHFTFHIYIHTHVRCIFNLNTYIHVHVNVHGMGSNPT